MFSLSSIGLTSETIKILFVFYFILGLASAALAVTFYVLKAVGIYKMSKSLGFRGRWFAFVPYFCDFAYGRLAGAQNKENPKKFAKLLLSLNIVASVLTVFSTLLISLSFIDLLFAADNALLNNETLDTASLQSFIIPIVFMIVAIFVYIAYYIVFYVCTYKIFKVFAKQNAVLYLVLSILFSFLLPIFLFINKDNRPDIDGKSKAEDVML